MSSNKKWLIIIGVLLFLTGFSVAPCKADTYLEVNVASYHSRSTYSYQGAVSKFNQANYGLGIVHDISERIEIKGGAYKNSYGHLSVYAAGNIHQPITLDNGIYISPGVVVGLVSGYQDTPEHTKGVMMPMVIPNVTIGKGRLRAVIGHIPAVLGARVALTTLQFQVRF